MVVANKAELVAQQLLGAEIIKKQWGSAMYNVLVEGLSGDGVTDDTSKLQALIDTAIAAGRKAIFFPHGTYYVTSLTSANQVVFFGDNASFVGGYAGIIHQIGDWVSEDAILNVFNVNAYASIDNAISDASINGGTVFFPAGTHIVNANITIPSNVTLKFDNGGSMSIGAGVTVTINGPIEAELHQIFSGSGTVNGAIKNERLFPQWWGAKANGVVDDTAAINAAITAAGLSCKAVCLPAGTYLISAPLRSTADSVVIHGQGMKNTTIAPNGNFDVFQLSHNDLEIFELCFVPTVVQTSGNAIKITNCAGHKLHELTIATYSGITWDRGANGFIRDISMSNIKGTAITLESSTPAGSVVGIFIGTITGGGIAGSVGFRIGSGCSGIYISKGDMLTFGNGVIIDNRTAAAEAPVYVFFDTVLADTCSDNGYRIDAGDSIYLDKCWGSSATNQGFNITGGSDIWLRGCMAVNNGQHGVLIQTSGVNNNGVHLRDVDAWGNSKTTANTANGISVVSNINNFTIIGCKSGRGPRLTNQQNYGILVAGGTSNNYIVANNIALGNTTAGISDGGTGVTKSVVNNI